MSKKILQDTDENIKLVKTLYEDDKSTYTDIAIKLSVKPDVIRRFISRNGIQIRKTSESLKLKNKIEENIEKIIYLFKIEQLSTTDIGKIYDVDRKTISNYLNNHGIDVDLISKLRKTKKQQFNLNKLKKLTLSDEELIELYARDDMNVCQIGKLFNVSPRAVKVRLCNLNIPIKSLKELFLNDNFRDSRIKVFNESAHTEEANNKRGKTNIQRYGVDNPFKSEYFKNKIFLIKFERMNQKSSRQQIYIHNLVGGEINYPFGRCSIDIAFPDDKICVEYDGSGHDLSVKLNQVSREDYDKKEMKRSYYLIRNGWKIIRIISKKDKLPSDEVISELMTYAKEYLNENHHYIYFDVDESTVKTSQFKEKYDFGRTRCLKRLDKSLPLNIQSPKAS